MQIKIANCLQFEEIVSGYTNGKFGPNDTITCEQLAVILYRYVGSPTNNQHALQFTDARTCALDFVHDPRHRARNRGVSEPVSNGTGSVSRGIGFP